MKFISCVTAKGSLYWKWVSSGYMSPDCLQTGSPAVPLFLVCTGHFSKDRVLSLGWPSDWLSPMEYGNCDAAWFSGIGLQKFCGFSFAFLTTSHQVKGLSGTPKRWEVRGWRRQPDSWHSSPWPEVRGSSWVAELTQEHCRAKPYLNFLFFYFIFQLQFTFIILY